MFVYQFYNVHALHNVYFQNLSSSIRPRASKNLQAHNLSLSKPIAFKTFACQFVSLCKNYPEYIWYVYS